MASPHMTGFIPYKVGWNTDYISSILIWATTLLHEVHTFTHSLGTSVGACRQLAKLSRWYWGVFCYTLAMNTYLEFYMSLNHEWWRKQRSRFRLRVHSSDKSVRDWTHNAAVAPTSHSKVTVWWNCWTICSNPWNKPCLICLDSGSLAWSAAVFPWNPWDSLIHDSSILCQCLNGRILACVIPF